MTDTGSTRPPKTGLKFSVGDADDLAFAAKVNDALRPYSVRVSPSVATSPDGTVEYRLIAESGSKRDVIRSAAPFHKANDAVAKVVADVQRWLSGAGASSDGLIGKRWAEAKSDEDFL
jgi:hypothetical protein